MLLGKRLQFKLSSIIVLTAAAAIVCLEARWQFEQRQLERQAKSVGARVDYLPRSRTGYLWSCLILSPRSHFVAGLQFDAYLLDSRIFPSQVGSRSEVLHTLSLRAARQLRSLRLRGTAIDQRVLARVAQLKGLSQISLQFTAVSAEEAERLANRLPDCQVFYGESNGEDFVRLAHSELFSLTDSVDDFVLACEGNAQAVARLIRLNCQGNVSLRNTLANSLQQATSVECQVELENALRFSQPHVRGNAIAALALQGCLPAMQRGLSDPDAGVRSTAIYYIAKRSNDWAAEALCSAVNDVDLAVREAAILALSKSLNRHAMTTLIAATQDTDARIRMAAIQALEQVSTQEVRAALLKRLSDVEPAIRAAAAAGLGQHRDTPTIQALTDASQDPIPAVRAAAISALSAITQHLQSQQQKNLQE